MKLLQQIDSLTQIDIEVLMSRSLREGPQLEYKETLLPLSDHKKSELLKDVSSMANSDGGVIVFRREAGPNGNTGKPAWGGN